VFRRSAGAPLIVGNRVRVLRDGRENYPAWEAAINSAQATFAPLPNALALFIFLRAPLYGNVHAMSWFRYRSGAGPVVHR